jgi:hypothetical protein
MTGLTNLFGPAIQICQMYIRIILFADLAFGHFLISLTDQTQINFLDGKKQSP